MRWLHASAVFVLLVVLAAPGVPAAGNAMTFKDADIHDVLNVLAELGGVNVVTDPQVRGTVSFSLRDMDPLEAIDLIVRTNGYSYLWVDDTIVVGPEQTLSQRFEPTRAVFFPLRYADPAAVAPALSLVVQPATVQADPTFRGVLVRGTEEQLALAKAFLEQRDVPRRLSLDFQDADLVTVFHALALEGGYNLLLETPLEGKLTILLQGIDVDEGIRLAAQQSGVRYRIEGNSLIVGMAGVAATRPVTAAPSGGAAGGTDGPAAETTQVRVFTLHYIEPALAQRIVAMAAPAAAVQSEQVGGSLLVRGTEAELEAVATLLERFDLPAVRVDGIVIRGDERLAVVSVAGRSHLVREGDAAGDLAVVRISDKEVTFRTARGHMLHVPIGGSE